MKVNLPPTTQAMDTTRQTEKTQKTSKQADISPSAGREQASEIEISDDAQLIRKANDIVSSAPDQNVDKIQRLKKQIQDGTYQIEASKLADKIIEDHLQTHFGKNSI